MEIKIEKQKKGKKEVRESQIVREREKEGERERVHS